ACGANDGPSRTPAKGPSIPPAAAGERSERKPGRTRRAAAGAALFQGIREAPRCRKSNRTVNSYTKNGEKRCLTPFPQTPFRRPLSADPFPQTDPVPVSLQSRGRTGFSWQTRLQPGARFIGAVGPRCRYWRRGELKAWRCVTPRG